MVEFGVAVKAVIKKDDKYLVINKSDDEDIAPDTLDLPGGRVEFEEELEPALKREVLEEVGLDIEIKFPVNAWTFVPKDDFQLTGITYLCLFKGGEVKLSDEHKGFSWLTMEELGALGLPSWAMYEFEMAEKVFKVLPSLE